MSSASNSAADFASMYVSRASSPVDDAAVIVDFAEEAVVVVVSSFSAIILRQVFEDVDVQYDDEEASGWRCAAEAALSEDETAPTKKVLVLVDVVAAPPSNSFDTVDLLFRS